MQREIGGYFEWERYDGSEYYADLMRLDSVRSALHLIIQERGYKRIWLPAHLCGCFADFLDEINMPYCLHRINENYEPLDIELDDGDCVFLVNFYGQLTNDELQRIAREFKNQVFIDNTHAFFLPPIADLDTAYSCRKYLGGCPEGTYLSTTFDSEIAKRFPRNVAAQAMAYSLGRFEDGAGSHYEEFQSDEAQMRGVQIKRMSALVENLLKSFDYTSIKNTRQMNFEYLDERLKGINRLEPRSGGLFCYPLLIEDATGVREKLAQRKVFIPTLWKDTLDRVGEDSWEADLTLNLLPLPIDQRYNSEDMQYMIDCLLDAIGIDDSNGVCDGR